VRHLLPLAALLALTAAAAAQVKPPPGTIVFEPKKPTAPAPADPAPPGRISVMKGSDPKFPGFIVFSPTREQAAKLLPYPSDTSRVETGKDGIPTITIVGKGAKDPPPADPAKPVQGGKPVLPEPEKVEDGKILIDTYDSAYCRGCKVGYLHTLVREYERNGKKVLYGSKKLTLQVARFGQPVEQWVEETTIETTDGKVLRTTCRQGVGKNQMLELSGEVTDKGLVVTISGSAANPAKETVPWPEGVLGVAKEASLLKDMRPKAGTAVEYQTYFGQFNGVITYKFKVVGTEEADPDGSGKKRKLIKVVQLMTPVKSEQGEFKQPPVTYWLDPDTYDPQFMETDLAPLGGTLTAKRTTREVALAKPTKYLDLGEVQSIKLAAAVPGLHNKDSATYTFTLTADGPPLARAFATDARQTVKVLDEKAGKVEVSVTAIRKPTRPTAPAVAPGKEYLSDSFYIDWNNDVVKKHAAAAAAGLPKTATDWEKAKAVETWVHKNMKQVEFSQAMASCQTVAKELRGDCTEHSMLAVGMCRALGVPARTALGLVYAEGNAQLAYHMWYEVWADGGWVALDAITGRGSVGPGHVKIVDAHWDGEKGFTPLLPVLGLLSARPQVTVK
jgi:metal-sulfur cluster biosynthetic enzyme